MEVLAKKVNGQELLTIFAKRLIEYVWLAPILVTKIYQHFKSPISRNYFEMYGAINFSQILYRLNYLHALLVKISSFNSYNFHHLSTQNSLLLTYENF